MIVEDGSGIAGANSYVTTEEANTFHADRSNGAWTAASTGFKESALINASDYIDANYKFDSFTSSSTQGLAWPRYGILNEAGYAQAGVPVAVKKATMMLALEALSGSLQGAQDSAQVLSTEQSLDGVGSTKMTFAKNTKARFPAVDAILASVSHGRVSSGMRTIVVNRI